MVTPLLVFVGIINQLIVLPCLYAGDASQGKSRFGVAGGIERFSPQMQEAGVEIVREWIVWEQIEPVKGQYDWPVMDEKVQKANSSGIEILGYFVHMPSWAKKKQKDLEPAFAINQKYPPKKKYKKGAISDFSEPKDINDFREFAKAVAERYDGKHGHGEMKYVEILNEVTVLEFYEFNNPGNPYKNWLVNGYKGVKEGNPNARVLIGGFVEPCKPGGNKVLAKFIDDMLANYADYYDIVNFHSYSKDDSVIIESTKYIKERMQAYGVNKPIWITETATLIGLDDPDWKDKLAQGVVKRYVAAFGEGVEKVFWWPFVGAPVPEEDPSSTNEKHTALGWDRKGEFVFHPRPAYYAYQLMTSKLKGFSSVEKITDTQYKFIVNGKNVYVLWCDSGTRSLPSEIKGRVKVTDYLGREETKNVNQLTLTSSPVFVEGI